jgi:glutamate/tyrosine decarboxylase-like PLP-dependent enzyme
MSVEAYAPVLRQAMEHAIRHLAESDSRPVAATASLDLLRRRLDTDLPPEGRPATDIIDELVRATEGGLLGSTSGRFFAWVIGGTLPAAMAADWLTSAWDQNAALFACSPASAVVEEVCGKWVKSILGLPQEASFALTTGGQMAHTTCLAAARHAVLRDVGWNVEQRGLCGAPRIAVLTSDQYHGSVERAVRFLGLGTESLVVIPTDSAGCLTGEALASAIHSTTTPRIVVLQAGDLNIGAFDPFAELIPIATEAGAWVHVDGAFGLWARASRSRKSILNGVEQAHSWAVDCHKWLNVPQDSGLAIVADSDAHRAALAVQVSYLTGSADARDQIDWNAEWSRRARGFSLYAALRELGRGGIENLVDRCCQCALRLAQGIGALDGAEILWTPKFNQGLVHFRDPRALAGESDHDSFTEAVVAAVNRGGEAFFSTTTWRGQRAMRISVVNWQTSEIEIDRAISAIAKALATERLRLMASGSQSPE